MQSRNIMRKNKSNQNISRILLHKYIRSLKSYFLFLPNFLLGSGTAFIVDFSLYTYLRPNIGTNWSALVAFSFGTLTLYIVLRLKQQSKIKRKRVGLVLQFLVGLGSLAINISILNSFDYILNLIEQDLYSNVLNSSSYYAGITKLISAAIGFIWTSSMSAKLLFSHEPRL